MRNHLDIHPKKAFVFEIQDTVRKLKSLRKGMVQTISQYQFAYRSVLEEAQSLGLSPINNHE